MSLSFLTGDGSDELLEAIIPIIDDDICQNLYEPEPVTEEMLCAGDIDNGRGICYVSCLLLAGFVY